MNGIIVCGHGMYATGITSALELIMGKQEYLEVVDFKKGETNTELQKNIKKAIDKYNQAENVLVMCDLLSGSPFNNAIVEAMNDERIHVVYGTNLGMLMELVLKRNMGSSIEELLDTVVKTGKEQVGLFITPHFENETDDFDE